MSAADYEAAARQTVASLGYPAQLRLVEPVEPVSLLVPPMRELPASRVKMQYGLDDVRMADATLWRSELRGTTPGKDAVLDLFDGPQSGAWRVLGIEAQDAVCVVVRLRRSTPVSTTAPGARDLRR